MPELLFEIGTEELPAIFVAPTMVQLEAGFREKFTVAKLWGADSGTVKVSGTPRRLVIYATGLSGRQADETLQLKGPSAAVAFDPQGKPTGAAFGFARKNGISVEELSEGKDIMHIMGKLLPKLMGQMTTGGFNGDAFAKFKELAPILERYKHLAPKINE